MEYTDRKENLSARELVVDRLFLEKDEIMPVTAKPIFREHVRLLT